MATIPLPPDFSAFLKSLSTHDVDYLLVGGYAVGYYGYIRATADMDVWVRRESKNAKRIVSALHEFGFGTSDLNPTLFLTKNRVAAWVSRRCGSRS